MRYKGFDIKIPANLKSNLQACGKTTLTVKDDLATGDLSHPGGMTATFKFC
jgi:hypothetical protein